jgi:ABC-type multidrug transport system fused ATPase/permease subunit
MGAGIHSPSYRDIFKTLTESLAFEKKNLQYILIYNLLIGAFSVGASLVVQFVVNEISFTGQVYPLVILTLILIVLLTFAAIAQIARKILIELVQRRLLLRLSVAFADSLPQGIMIQPFEKRHLLAHRFFEVFNYQKALSVLLIDGLGTILFMLLSLLVIVFYHPVLFFLMIFIVLGFVVTIHFFLKPALSLHYAQSNQKYHLAETVDELLRSQRTLWPKLKRSLSLMVMDQRTLSFLEARQNYFRLLLSQQSVLYILEIFGAALFLSVGGGLVLSGQMQMGQLVAAESLIVALLYNIAEFWKTLESSHDLVTASKKLEGLILPPLQSAGPHMDNPPPLQELKIIHQSSGQPIQSWVLRPGSIYAFQCPHRSLEKDILQTFLGEKDQKESSSWKLFWNELVWDTFSQETLREHIWLLETTPIFPLEIAGESMSGILQWTQQQWSEQGLSAQLTNDLLTNRWLPENPNPEAWTQDEKSRVALTSLFLPHTKSIIWISGLIEQLQPEHKTIFFNLCSRWLRDRIIIVSDVSWRYPRPEWVALSEERTSWNC